MSTCQEVGEEVHICIEAIIERARIALVCGLHVADIVRILMDEGCDLHVAHNAVRAAQVANRHVS